VVSWGHEGNGGAVRLENLRWCLYERERGLGECFRRTGEGMLRYSSQLFYGFLHEGIYINLREDPFLIVQTVWTILWVTPALSHACVESTKSFIIVNCTDPMAQVAYLCSRGGRGRYKERRQASTSTS
jgi:hypothetical protein